MQLHYYGKLNIFQGFLRRESANDLSIPIPNSGDQLEETASAGESEASVQGESPKRSLRPDGFKLLQAKLAASRSLQSGTRRDSTQRRRVDDFDLISRELEHFLEMDIPKNSETDYIDPVVFWKQHASTFPHLLKVALTLCAIPASSGESERLFSAAGWLCNGKKNRLTKLNLAAKVFLCCNKVLLRGRLV